MVRDRPICHICSREAWLEARRAGVYRGDTLETEGFIHCSEPRQVRDVAERLFRGRRGLVLLVIDPERVAAEIRWEAAESDERYPHIYGALDPAAVVEVRELTPREDGGFADPEVPG